MVIVTIRTKPEVDALIISWVWITAFSRCTNFMHLFVQVRTFLFAGGAIQTTPRENSAGGTVYSSRDIVRTFDVASAIFRVFTHVATIAITFEVVWRRTFSILFT